MVCHAESDRLIRFLPPNHTASLLFPRNALKPPRDALERFKSNTKSHPIALLARDARPTTQEMAQPANANATSEPSQPSSSALPELPWQPLVRTFEPYASLLRPNFHTGAKTGLGVQEADLHALKDSPTPGLDLNDQDLYYNTERDEEAYWKGTNLPVPTKDPAQMRRDLMKWGYCLVAEALSPAQLDAIRTRIYEQADGERLAGVASLGASMPRPGEQVSTTQLVHSLLNKGDIFRRLLEFEAEVTQGGKMIEQMLVDVLGDNFLISTFLSLITEPGNIPQNLHQDQVLMVRWFAFASVGRGMGWEVGIPRKNTALTLSPAFFRSNRVQPYQTPQGPVSCNTMYFLDDFNRTTGSTLVIPGSHLLMPKSIPMKEPLPPPVNVVGPAGTCLIFEGRLIHGTGVNKGTSRRAALIMDSRMPFMRPQELFPLSLAPDVMMRLSPKSLARLGFRPTGMGGAEGVFLFLAPMDFLHY